MKKIVLIVFLLAVCAAAGRAQESRQDISISGSALIEPFIASSTDVQVHSTTAYGALASYRFMLTPTSALEANYGITYQNRIHYFVNPEQLRSPDAHPGDLRRFCAFLRLQELQSLCGGGPAGFIFLPIRQLRPADPRRSNSRPRSAPSTARASPTKSAPASTSAPISRPGHQGAHFRRQSQLDTNKWCNIYEPVVGVAYHF